MNPTAIPSTGYAPYTPYVPYNQQGNQAISQAQNVLNTPQPVNTPSAVPVDKGNWLTHLLPTLGSFAGMAAPTLLGLLGAPETGGLSLLAGLGTSAGLAAAGSGAGKVAENAVEGTPQNPGDIATSALEGAGGQLIGGAAGKLIGDAGGAISNGIKNAVTGKTEQATLLAAAQAAKDAAANKVALYGEGVKAATDPSIGAKFQSTLDNAEKTYGINTLDPNAPKLMSEVGHAQTGGNIENGQGALNETVDQILAQNPGKVNLSGIGDELNHSVQNLNSTAGTSGTLDQMVPKGKTLVPVGNPAQKAVAQIANLSPNLSSAGGTGLVASQMTSAEADTLAKGLQKIAFSKVPISSTGFQDPVALAKANIASDLYNYVRGEVDNQPGLSDVVKNIRNDPNLEKFVDGKVSGISDPTVQAATKQKLLDTFNNAENIQHLRAAQADAVQMSKLGDQVHNFNTQRTYTPKAPGRDAVGTSTPPNPGGNLLDAASLIGAPFTGGASLLGLVPHALRAAQNPAVQNAIVKLLDSGVSKKVAQALPLALTGASQFITHAPNETASPVNLNIGNNTMPPTTLDPNSLNAILLRQAIVNAANPGTQSSAVQEIGQILPQIQSANANEQALTGAENAFQQAGGGQGGILGNLQKLLGGITGAPASQYEQQRQTLVNLLQGNAQTPGLAPGTAVPDITGNNASAANQFQTIENILRARLNGGSVLGGLPQ